MEKLQLSWLELNLAWVPTSQHGVTHQSFFVGHSLSCHAGTLPDAWGLDGSMPALSEL